MDAKPKQRTINSFFTTYIAAKKPDSNDEPGQSTEGNTKVTEEFNHDGKELGSSFSVKELNDTSASQTQWPSVWTQDMWDKKKDAFPWLDCKEGKLGCKICFEINSLGTLKKEHVSLSREWRSYQVTYYGSNRTNQLKSLRKKIVDHKQSQAHISAKRILDSANVNPMHHVIDSINAKHLESTNTIFRSAYFLAKNNRPYSDHFGLLELQKLNGVDIGVGLHSRYSAVEIIDHISKEMRMRILKKVKEISGKISLIIDEATSISSKSVVIVYLKCEIDKQLSPKTIFLDLVELENQKSDAVFNSTLACLGKYGFDHDYLKQNLVSFTSDGASVMLGKQSGVAARFLSLYPDIMIWHCMNHRLELAIGDAVNEVAGVNHFQSFMDKLYTLYSTSSKNKRELKESAIELDIQINKIGRVLSTRWVASSFRTVSAVWYGYAALAKHFTKAMNDPDRSSLEKQKYAGLLKKLTCQSFLSNLAFMYDILAELSLLSESLESRSTSVVFADKLIRRSIRYLESLKDKPGTKVLEAQTAMKEGSFAAIELNNNKWLRSHRAADDKQTRVAVAVSQNSSKEEGDESLWSLL